MQIEKNLRHQDLFRETRIRRAAEAAALFVTSEVFFCEDESFPELSLWLGVCDEFEIEIKAVSRKSCEIHLRESIVAELVADYKKAYSILLKNNQIQFFL